MPMRRCLCNILDICHENWLEIIIDIFLPVWQWQTRFVRILGTNTNAHECIIREGMVVTHDKCAKGEGPALESSWKQTWPQNQHANLPNNYSDCPSCSKVLRSSLDLGYGVTSYIAFGVTVYDIRYTLWSTGPGYVLRAHRGGSERATESKEPQGVFIASTGRHLTSLNMAREVVTIRRSLHEIRALAKTDAIILMSVFT